MKFDFAMPGAARRAKIVAHLKCALAALLMFTVLLAASTPADLFAEIVTKGMSGRSVRDDALRAIPMQQLAPNAQAKVSAVLNDVSIFRRLPTQSIDCDPALFHYLVSNPDIVVNIWRLMGVTNVSMDRLDAEHFRGSDGDGTNCHAEYVFHNHDTHIIYADGFYDGPMYPRTIRGQCVAVLKTAEIRETNGRYYVTARLDVFLHVENTGVELVAKMFQGWLGKTVDHNFTETVAFIGNISHTAETNPHGIRKLASRLNRIDDARRQGFVMLSDQVSANLAGINLASGQQAANTRP